MPSGIHDEMMTSRRDADKQNEVDEVRDRGWFFRQVGRRQWPFEMFYHLFLMHEEISISNSDQAISGTRRIAVVLVVAE